MTVHFIGAGPGAADLITLRGRDLLARCPICLYAGSLVSEAVLAHCPPGARLAIPYTITPGVPAFAAAAAALGKELTLPEIAQSVVLTRTPGRASAMPAREKLATFASTGATLAIHLSIHALDALVAELLPHYGAQCPVAIVYRASWPDERILRGCLADICAQAKATPIERSALIFVGPALAAKDFAESALYNSHYVRRFRGGDGPGSAR
jgi:precorrin-4/cobalt-precorrin-4 C11-methyltransferase